MAKSYSIMIAWLFLVVCCVSCKKVEQVEIPNEQKLLAICEDYVKTNFHYSIDELKYEHVIKSEKNYWIVTYKLPEGTIGGVPTIYISKTSMTVIKAIHSQ
jgi:hypothetical protein